MKEKLEEVLREYWFSGKSYAQIARDCGYSRQYIQQICSRKTPEN